VHQTDQAALTLVTLRLPAAQPENHALSHAGVARRLISLQDLFPTADVSKLASKRHAHVSASMPLHGAMSWWHARVILCRVPHPAMPLIACRPGLLLDSIFRHVPAARAELAQLFPQTDIDLMVQVTMRNNCNM
jgi:hypothetical protein